MRGETHIIPPLSVDGTMNKKKEKENERNHFPGINIKRLFLLTKNIGKTLTI